jgi:hypothetical protein
MVDSLLWTVLDGLSGFPYEEVLEGLGDLGRAFVGRKWPVWSSMTRVAPGIAAAVRRP